MLFCTELYCNSKKFGNGKMTVKKFGKLDIEATDNHAPFSSFRLNCVASPVPRLVEWVC